MNTMKRRVDRIAEQRGKGQQEAQKVSRLVLDNGLLKSEREKTITAHRLANGSKETDLVIVREIV